MITKLMAAIEAVAPDKIVGVAIGSPDDRATWRVDFAESATDADRAAAAAVVSSFDPRTPTAVEIAKERQRRLALGFDYDFGDGRGVHRIGTSPADMTGWAEVSTYAGALLAHGDVTTTIAIVTDTGPVEVTALEWQAIEIAAAAYRQPIWARSFALQQLRPVNYTDDAHWS